MIQQKLDTLLASHTAPTLMGVKPANLVSLPRFETFKQMVQKRAFLLSYGYPVYRKNNVELYFDEILFYLAQRIQSTKGFPHEIGIFLGYPLEDVVGFITNNGCNYKYSGCWKVYGDETYSRRLFAQYKSCKQQLSQALKDTDGNLLHCLCTNSIIQNRSV